MTATTVSAPEARIRRRGALTWIGIAGGFIAIGLVGSLLAGIGERSSRGSLDPESAGPGGTRALAEILRDNGVDVVVSRSWQEARERLDEQPAALFLPDAPQLSDDAVASLAGAAAVTVLGDPRSRTLRQLLDDSSPAGFSTSDALDPACTLPAAERAGAVTVQGLFTAGGGVTGCYPDGDAFGLLVAEPDGSRVAAVDADGVFTNDALARAGNAALAISLLGAHDTLVWYVASPGDSDLPVTDPTLGELTPPWVSPVIVLLLLAGVVVGIARGRRFGPLVAERLPVTVRAGETDEGRGRLYAASRDAAHAAKQLRLGTRRRLAGLLGLGPAESAERIADAAADVLGADRRIVRGILIDTVPRDDGELVSLSDDLRGIEAAVRARLHPSSERSRP